MKKKATKRVVRTSEVVQAPAPEPPDPTVPKPTIVIVPKKNQIA